MTDRSRIQCKAIADKVISAEGAAAIISLLGLVDK
jgi:hypothetical protein